MLLLTTTAPWMMHGATKLIAHLPVNMMGHGVHFHHGILLGRRRGRRRSLLLSEPGHLLLSRLAHGYPLAHVAHGGVLEQTGKDHDETGAQIDIDRLDVRYFGQRSIGGRHQRGHGQHSGHTQLDASGRGVLFLVGK